MEQYTYKDGGQQAMKNYPWLMVEFLNHRRSSYDSIGLCEGTAWLSLQLKKSLPLTIITSAGVFWNTVLFIGPVVRQDLGPNQGWPAIPCLSKGRQCSLNAFHVPC